MLTEFCKIYFDKFGNVDKCKNDFLIVNAVNINYRNFMLKYAEINLLN